MKFEWDINKNKENFKKHGILFEYITDFFTDNNRIERYDYQHSNLLENCYNAIGLSHNHILFVVFKYNDDETIRIISARFATKKEEDLYYEKCYFY